MESLVTFAWARGQTQLRERMTKTQMHRKGTRAAIRVSVAAFLLTAATAAWAQQTKYPVPSAGQFPTAPTAQMPSIPTPQAITPNGQVVEDVIVRVNDRVITRSEYERALKGIVEDAQRSGAPASEVEDRERNLLRDMIDQQILLAKGKELNITGDAETMRQLDEIRKQNHLDSMEALQKAAEQQGVSFEDFKQGIRDRIISQKVVQSEVGRSIRMTHAQEEAYYAAHKQDFAVPEQVHLSEILIPTPENATDAQIAEAQKKADDAAALIKGGQSFAEVAKKASGGPTASAGGDLGDFKRGALGQVLEDATFSLPVGGVTAPIRTRQGFVILRVDSHQQPGVPPLEQIEPQVQEAVYMDAMQPAMRSYLTKMRKETYVDVKPGFVDTGSDKKDNKPAFTAYTAPTPKKKIVAKQKAEQEKAQRAQEALMAAREKVREKEEAKAAEQARKAGVKDVAMPVKPKKVKKEKIRYGQAPRLSLPAGGATLVSENNALAGQAPGAAMAPTDSTTTITTGTGGTDINDDPLAPHQELDHKARFSDREKQAEEDRAKAKLVKASARATARPARPTATETVDEKVQAAPLGLNGDTVKKTRKKHVKGEPKERIQEKPKPSDAPAPVEPTVNPNLTAPVAPAPAAQTAPQESK